MKTTFLFFTVILLSISSLAQSGNLVFKCQSTIKVDTNQSYKVGIQIYKATVGFNTHLDFGSYLGGSANNSVWPTIQQVASLKEALEMTGIELILGATKISPVQRKKITTVVIYTAGNFDDDAAGVRAAEFKNARGQVLASGQFFGWGGPLECQKR